MKVKCKKLFVCMTYLAFACYCLLLLVIAIKTALDKLMSGMSCLLIYLNRMVNED